MGSHNQNFTVSVRKRPLNVNNLYENKINLDDDVISTSHSTISVHEEKQKVNLDYYESIKTFRFDYVFSDSTNNLGIYKILLKKRIDNLKNTICYTFGETGSGKTHTLFGKNLGMTREFGLIEASLYDLLKKTKIAKITAFEIYNNKLYDLLTQNLTQVEMYEKAGNVHVNGLENFACNVDNVQKFINIIMENRKIGTSSENNRSSRSHVVIKILSNETNLIFVDVAGCERGNYIRIAQDIQNEMININRDNFALKECMRSILNNKNNKNNNRIPFRLSKITMALKESFYDNYETVLITTINPKKINIPTTLNILSYINDFKMYSKPPKPIIQKIEKIKLPLVCETSFKNIQQIRRASEPPLISPRSEDVPIRNVKSAQSHKTKTKEILKKLIQLIDEEKIIYMNFLKNKETIGFSKLYGNKLAVIKLNQIDLLNQLNFYDSKNIS